MAEIMISTLAILISIVIMFLHQRALAKSWIPSRRLMKLFRCKVECVTNSAQKRSSSCDFYSISYQKRVNTKSFKVINALQAILDWIEENKQEKALMAAWNEIFGSVDLISMTVFVVVNTAISACLIF